MIQKQNVIIISFLILSLIECTPPPTPKYEQQIKPGIPKLVIKGKKPHLSSKRLLDSGSGSTLKITNSTATIDFHDTYRTVDHKMILIPQNLPSGGCFGGYTFSYSSPSITFEDITKSCEILDSNGKGKNCDAQHTSETNSISFIITGNICEGDKLIINYKYKDIRKNSADILYKRETLVIPLISKASFCNYKYKIPNGYKNLGLLNNYLTKDSKNENIYYYNKQCPDEQINDEIRFSPKEAVWETDTKINLESPTAFTNDVIFRFPKYYKGGKLEENDYKILSSENEEYNEKDITYEDIKYQINIPPANKLKVGVEIKANFTNNLDNKFNPNIPVKYYSIDLSNVDQEIQDKAKEIKSQSSDLPDYQKIGKWLNSYMNYDISYTGENLTLKQIYERKTGVCEHYTLLYNAMLNTIGIKTLYVTGWAFNGTQTSGNETTIGHAWTAALIDGKWKEIDATWGLFEGIPSSHIFKNYKEDVFSYSTSGKNKDEVNITRTQNIKMITEPKFEKEIDEDSDDETDAATTSTNNDGDDEDDDSKDFTVIRTNGYYGKPSLLLLILLCFL